MRNLLEAVSHHSHRAAPGAYPSASSRPRRSSSLRKAASDRARGQLRSGHPGRLRQLTSGGIEHQLVHVQGIGYSFSDGVHELLEAARRDTPEFPQWVGGSPYGRQQPWGRDSSLVRIGRRCSRSRELRQQPEVSKRQRLRVRASDPREVSEAPAGREGSTARRSPLTATA